MPGLMFVVAVLLMWNIKKRLDAALCNLGHEITELKNEVKTLKKANKNGLDSCG